MAAPSLIEQLSGSALVRPRVNQAFHLYARVRRARLARLDPARVQRKTLIRLVRQAARTRFGIDHRFDAIREVGDFQKSVPLRTYEDFWNEYLGANYPDFENLAWPGRI